MSAIKALVQTYLHINGYFTVAELPILRPRHLGGVRLIAEVPLLAFRLPRAGCEPPWIGARAMAAETSFEPDPMLCGLTDESDLLVVEIGTDQPGRRGPTFDRAALAAALVRFGGCGSLEAPEVVRTLVLHGNALSDRGYLVRLAAVEAPTGAGVRGLRLPIAHVAGFVRQYLDHTWNGLYHAGFPDGDGALAFQAMLKWAGLEPASPDDCIAGAPVWRRHTQSPLTRGTLR